MTETIKTGQALAEAKKPSMMAQLKNGLESMAPELKTALPANITTEKFISTAITGIRTSKDPAKLLNADRRSLYNAVQTAASYGLVLDSREAALVPFGDQVQFMPMVQGLVKLARNSGLISTIIAEVVYSKDKFSYRIGIDETPHHEPDWFADDRGEPVGVWALVTLTDGSKIHAILPKRKVMAIANGSKNSKQYDIKEGKHFDEWWKKTAIKNVLKYAPKSTELEKLERLANYDDSTQGVDSETGEIIESTPAPKEPTPAKRQGTRAASKIKEAMAAAPEPEPDNIIEVEFEETGEDYGQQFDDDEVPV